MEVPWLQERVTSWRALVAYTAGGFVVLSAVASAGGFLLRLAEGSDGATGVDRWVTERVVGHRSAGPTSLARLMSLVGSTSVLLPLVAVVTGLLVWRRRFVLAGALTAAWGGAVGLYNLIKAVVDRPRPPVGIRLATVSGTSFPSGHATQSLATYVLLALVTAAVWKQARYGAGIVAVIVIAGVGWSRVYLGVHWATDVAAGWLVGGAWAVLMIGLIGPVSALHPISPRPPPPPSGGPDGSQ